MPMFIKRLIVEGASFVCRVESTRWPVSAALTRDFGRLEVADFADQDDVGVLAKEGAKGGGEVQPDLLLHLDLVDAGQAGTRPDPRRS